MDQYVIYLRKSRADAEAEARGEGETLARHEHALLELSRRQKLNVTEIYREIVSGDTIAARPIMQKLLEEVERGVWTGVLVMEVERLARGDTMDQGLVAQTFKYSDTKIVTPGKTYDPSNEFDEEYFEFGLFMSRREYKTINRRLQRGRYASAKEGKFVGSIAPFGYEKIKIESDKGYTLRIVPDRAEIVRLIFSLYVNGEGGRRLGIQQIARRLNEMKIPPIRHDYWQKETIRDMLINPAYAGKIRWGWRPERKKMADGQRKTERPRSSEYVLVDGLHEAIIDPHTFALAQEYIESCPPAPVGYKSALKNPLAGLIVCGKCGRRMVLRKGYAKPDYIVCHSRSCDNVSAPFALVEQRVLDALKAWLRRYKTMQRKRREPSGTQSELLRRAVRQAENEVAMLEKQMGATHDLLERGVYTVDQFLDRSKEVSARLEAQKSEYERLKKDLGLSVERDEKQVEIVPKVEHLLEAYHSLSTAEHKNALLKNVLEKVVYTKEKSGCFRGSSADDFHIELFPRLHKREEITKA